MCGIAGKGSSRTPSRRGFHLDSAKEKNGFGAPITEWFREELKDLPREVLLDGRSLQRGFFERTMVQRIIDDHVSGARDNARKIWALIQFELWLRTFLDERGDHPLTLSVESIRRPRADRRAV